MGAQAYWPVLVSGRPFRAGEGAFYVLLECARHLKGIMVVALGI